MTTQVNNKYRHIPLGCVTVFELVNAVIRPWSLLTLFSLALSSVFLRNDLHSLIKFIPYFTVVFGVVACGLRDVGF